MINNQMINQMDLSQILQTIQKNNEQIIQMIQRIFQIQKLNNMLLKQILNNNLNNNNINNNMFNDTMNKMNNLMNNVINNSNMNMMNNNMMDNSLKNDIDPWAGNNARRLRLVFETGEGENIEIIAPEDISVGELIEAYFKRCHITNPEEQKKTQFIYQMRILNRADRSTLKEYKFRDINKIKVHSLGKIIGG